MIFRFVYYKLNISLQERDFIYLSLLLAAKRKHLFHCPGLSFDYAQDPAGAMNKSKQ